MLRPLTRLYCLPLLLSAPLSAQLLVPTQQSRSVQASAQAGFNPADEDSDSAPDEGPFSAAVFVSQTDPGGASATASANQSSQITGTGITATGSYAVEAVDFPSVAESSSLAAVSFDLTQPASYRISGFVEAFDFAGTSIFVLGDTGFQFSAGAGSFNPGYGFDQTGVLLPGSYTLEIYAFSEVADGSPVVLGSGAYAVDLQLAPIGTVDCVPTANSSGQEATIYSGGYPLAGQTGFGLGIAGAPPGVTGLFLYGAGQPPVPFGDGVLCLGGPLVRFPSPQLTSPQGTTGTSLNFHGPPFGSGPWQILPGSTWSFQFWFRDLGGPAGWNTSGAVTVLFLP